MAPKGRDRQDAPVEALPGGIGAFAWSDVAAALGRSRPVVNVGPQPDQPVNAVGGDTLQIDDAVVARPRSGLDDRHVIDACTHHPVRVARYDEVASGAIDGVTDSDGIDVTNVALGGALTGAADENTVAASAKDRTAR